jgi:hypothetical protein
VLFINSSPWLYMMARKAFLMEKALEMTGSPESLREVV